MADEEDTEDEGKFGGREGGREERGVGGRRQGPENLYANVALDSPRYVGGEGGGGGSSRQPTLPSRENFAATSVAVCQLFPRSESRGEGSEGVARGAIVFPGFAYTTIITDVFVTSQFRGRF